MGDTTITKVDSSHSPRGKMGQKYLASGISVAMRMWDGLEAGDETKAATREYETVGYVISGKAELELEGQTVTLKAGDSWVVPKGSKHSYRILDRFTAIEATHPPAQAHGRDD
jgi:quercetin dioxygenase-like cupin family protein